MSTSSEAPTIGIGRLLREGSRFVVPDHQRDYSWTADEIEQFFLDVNEARAGDQSEYFIGLMVFMPEEDRSYRILDGQQRLATTTIVFATLRDWLRQHGKPADASKIQDWYVAMQELGDERVEPRLVLNQNNHPAFGRFVVQETDLDATEKELKDLNRYDPNRRLLEAIVTCRAQVEAVAGSGSTAERASRLFDFANYLCDQVQIVRLSVSSEANAYTVFETLNDRGLDLTVLDLVKNFMFGKAAAPERLREVQTRWTQMLANLTAVRADDFLKTWWTSRHGRVQKAQLFPEFRKRVNSWSKAAEASKDMLRASELYSALEIADDPSWSRVNAEARERVRALKLIGGKQVHPVLLSALEKLNDRELERLLRLLEVLIVRYQLVGGGRTGRLEITCASLARKIWKEEVSTATEAAAVLRDIMPSDEEFRVTFATKQEGNSRKAVYLLTHLEREEQRLSTETGMELTPDLSLTLEHILPKNPGAEWAAALADDPDLSDDCTYRIGNLCLLTKVNRSLGNKAFGEKRKTYAKSKLLLSRRLAERDEWTRGEIESRQAHMAKLAQAIWRFQ